MKLQINLNVTQKTSNHFQQHKTHSKRMHRTQFAGLERAHCTALWYSPGSRYITGNQLSAVLVKPGVAQTAVQWESVIPGLTAA